jgi:hypothetical protein
MKEERKINWENRIRQLLANVRKEDKDRKVINFVRQLRQDDITSLIEWAESKKYKETETIGQIGYNEALFDLISHLQSQLKIN